VKSAALEAAEFELTVSIENLTREVERDGDLSAIARFVDHFEQVPEGKVAWDIAKQQLRLSLEPNDYDAETMAGLLQRPTSRQTMQVITRTTKTGVQFVTKEDLQSWGVTREQAEAIARENLDGLLVGKEPELLEVGSRKLGAIPIDGPSKASLVLAPGFRRFVEPKLGWPVLAVTPCRDFVYVFAKDDFDLVGRAGGVVLKEFEKSDHPISTEVWRVSDTGLEAIGALGGQKQGR
jgi:hypothetical protein